MTEQSIGDILNNEPAPEAPVEAPAETPTEAAEPQPETVERPRGPDGKFVAKESTGVQPQETPAEPVPPTEPTDRLPQAEYAALKDERSKRQTAEQERDQLRQQLMQYQAPKPQPQAVPEGPPDQWEDPDGYRDWLFKTARSEARAEALDAFHTQRIIASVAQFSADKPDYQEAISYYEQMASVNPSLDEQMRNAENPAKFAYDTAKLQLAIQQHGSLQGYIDAQIAAKQTDALSQVQSRLPQSAPPTISSDRSVGARSGPAWSGPAPLSELLK